MKGGTQKFRVAAKNKAIQISFQIIQKEIPLTSTKKSTTSLVEPQRFFLL